MSTMKYYDEVSGTWKYIAKGAPGSGGDVDTSMLLQYFVFDTSLITTSTGSTAQIVQSSTLIPANTFRVGSVFDVEIEIHKPYIDGTAVMDVYLGTTENSTSNPIGRYNWAAANRFVSFQRRLIVESGGLYMGMFYTVSAQTNIGTSQNSVHTIPGFDPTVDNYITVTQTSASPTNFFEQKLLSIRGRY